MNNVIRKQREIKVHKTSENSTVYSLEMDILMN